MAEKSQKPHTGAATFTMGQLANCEGFPRDLVNALLDENKTYTKEEAKGLLKQFLERKVK